MSEDAAYMFFTFGVVILVFVLALVSVKKFMAYLEKKRKERIELEEAAKMFEQRIALKPKHMGARHTSGAAPIIFGEVDGNDRPE